MRVPLPLRRLRLPLRLRDLAGVVTVMSRRLYRVALPWVRALGRLRAADMRIMLEVNGDVYYLKLSRRLQRVAAYSAAGVLLSTVMVVSGLVVFGASAQLQAWRAGDAGRRASEVLLAAGSEVLAGRTDTAGGDLHALAEAAARRQGALVLLLAEAVSALSTQNRAFLDRLDDVGLSEARLRAMAERQRPAAPAVFWRTAASRDAQAVVLTEIARSHAFREALSLLPREFPVDQPRLTSPWGMRRHPVSGRMQWHHGVDMTARGTDTVVASAAGTVVEAGREAGYGNVVRIAHGAGITTLYAHLASIHVKKGTQVATHAPIGEMGSTGLSTAKHLHFELLVDGRSIDPRTVIEAAQDVQETQE